MKKFLIFSAFVAAVLAVLVWISPDDFVPWFKSIDDDYYDDDNDAIYGVPESEDD